MDEFKHFSKKLNQKPPSNPNLNNQSQKNKFKRKSQFNKRLIEYENRKIYVTPFKYESRHIIKIKLKNFGQSISCVRFMWNPSANITSK
jgi:type IV secretory pathway component VirB8